MFENPVSWQIFGLVSMRIFFLNQEGEGHWARNFTGSQTIILGHFVFAGTLIYRFYG